MATRFAPDSPDAEATLYEGDFHAWLMEQGALLRARSANTIDWDNIAEEIEGLARSDVRELEHRSLRLWEHLTKLAVSTDEYPRDGWWQTVFEQRNRIEGVLRDSPSLRPRYPAILMAEWSPGARQARGGLRPEERARVPAAPFLTFDQALTLDDDAALAAALPPRAPVL